MTLLVWTRIDSDYINFNPFDEHDRALMRQTRFSHNSDELGQC